MSGEPTLFPVPPAPAKVRALPVGREQATLIVRDHWDNTHPRPMCSYHGLVAIVQKALDAGWPPNMVAWALTQTRAYTTGSIEFTLREAQATMTQRRQPKAMGAVLRLAHGSGK